MNRQDFWKIEEVTPAGTREDALGVTVERPAVFRLVMHVFGEDPEELKRLAEAISSIK